MPSRPLILASGSRYRQALLRRLAIPFDSVSPGVDETAHPGEEAGHLVRRLAQAKCAAVAIEHPDAVVIGSDQLACRGSRVLGKPGSEAIAITQLLASSGQVVDFLTAVCIAIPGEAQPRRHLDVTRVQFRTLTRDEIIRYIAHEQPLDCAGSFKCEGLGISLFERIVNSDPTALIGLPLIWTAVQLRSAGLAVP